MLKYTYLGNFFLKNIWGDVDFALILHPLSVNK